jgi:murein tripeptide amidase MpaA
MIRFPLRYLGYALALIIAVGIVVLIVLPEATVTPPTTETPVVDTPSLTAPESYTHTTIGTSVEGRSIEAYTFGTGEHNLLFVGGIHGGYEWNTVVLAYAFIDYFTQYPESIPEGITVHIIPSLNPDGIFAVTGLEGAFSEAQVTEIAPTATGRFNAHAVDLNRNFDC